MSCSNISDWKLICFPDIDIFEDTGNITPKYVTNLHAWSVRDTVELKTTHKLRATSDSSTIQSPSFKDISLSNILYCCLLPSSRRSVFDGLNRSFYFSS